MYVLYAWYRIITLINDYSKSIHKFLPWGSIATNGVANNSWQNFAYLGSCVSLQNRRFSDPFNRGNVIQRTDEKSWKAGEKMVEQWSPRLVSWGVVGKMLFKPESTFTVDREQSTMSQLDRRDGLIGWYDQHNHLDISKQKEILNNTLDTKILNMWYTR